MAVSTNQTIIQLISCPITHSIMINPVQGPDGITYEKNAIVRWLNEKGTSPMNPSLQMQASDLTLNYSIMHIIEQYNNGVFGSSASISENLPSSGRHVFKSKQDGINISGKYTLKDEITEHLGNNYLLSINSEFTSNSNADIDLKRFPHDIVVVLDRSGSMNMPVTAKNEDGNNLENGFSQEDIVTHAARTIAKTLDANDRLSIIAFDHVSETIFGLTLMNEQNKSWAMDKIKMIKPRGQTNIWAALLQSINLLDDRADKTRNTAIILLTDGSPNSSPALGEIETLKRMRVRTNFSTPIYACGFGYSLQRGLLYNISKLAGGVNCHIPDGTMVATVFCNLIANILTTVSNNVQLHLLTKNGAEIVDDVPLMGDFEYNLLHPNCTNMNSKKYCIDIGTVQMQQSRDLILKLVPNNGEIEYFLTYKSGGEYYVTVTKTIIKYIDSDCYSDYNKKIRSNIGRFYAVEQLRKAILEYPTIRSLPNKIGVEYIQNIKEKMITLSCKNNELEESLNDQITFALSDKVDEAAYFKKWGEFYLDQFTQCLNQQICPNYRDKALSVFGGENFTELMELSSEAFDQLEPPEPSLLNKINTTTINRGLSAQTMSQYNSRSDSNPCFHGMSTIRMADNTHKFVKELKMNDVVWTSNGIAYIKCVLQTNIQSGNLNMVNFPGKKHTDYLSITPYHPICIELEATHSSTGTQFVWSFPCDLQSRTYTNCNAVYSLVLDKHHIVEIGGIKCICLAHGYTEGILAHEYFGTQKVLDDMSKMPGWNQGRIIINDGCMKRDENTGLIIGFIDY
jgi:Mg-chelatase subunit ChlD